MRHQPHISMFVELLPIKGSDSCRFLSAMLERVQTKVGQFRNFLSRGIDPKHSTGFFRFIAIVIVKIGTEIEAQVAIRNHEWLQ